MNLKPRFIWTGQSPIIWMLVRISVSVVCILELMQCLSQVIARKAVRKGTTKQTSAAFESENLKKSMKTEESSRAFPDP